MGSTEQAQWGPGIPYVAERVMLLADPPPKPVSPKPRRRWFRFSLRTLLILTVLLSVAFGWLGSILVRVRHQRRIVAQIEAKGGRVLYDYQLAQLDRGFVSKEAIPPGPTLVRLILGDDVFAYVEDIGFWGSDDHPVTDQDLTHLPELPRLKDVMISDASGISDAGMESLAQVQQLRTVYLSDAKITPAGLGRITSKKTLVTLSLSGSWVTDESLAAVGEIPNLDSLDLTGTRVTSSGISHVARLESLRSLYIREVPGFDNAAMREVTKLNHLESLALRDTNVSDDGFRDVSNLKQLRELTVYRTPVSDSGIAHLAGLEKLTNVQLIGDQIGDGALEVMSKLPSLETLNMSATGITDEGLRHAAAMKNLRSLSITNTNVSDSGLVHLASLHKLRRLTLGPIVTEPGAKQLKRALPDCEIVLCDKNGSGDEITAD